MTGNIESVLSDIETLVAACEELMDGEEVDLEMRLSFDLDRVSCMLLNLTEHWVITRHVARPPRYEDSESVMSMLRTALSDALDDYERTRGRKKPGH